MSHTQIIMATPPDAYPLFEVTHIQNPSRLYAIPLLGGLIKLVMCIPQYFMLFGVALAWLVVTVLINPFVVLFTGKYWSASYSVTLSLLRLNAKVMLFFFGLTDKYPGFNFQVNSDFELEIPLPEKPSRLFAVPLLGGFVRFILLIPYFLYQMVIEYAVLIGVLFGASFVVLFTGKYPESVYELARDYTRITLATNVYVSGLKDSYPSFWISMNHKNIKIALIVLAVLYWVLYNMLSLVGAVAGVMSGDYKNNMPAGQYEEESLNLKDMYSEDESMYQYEEPEAVDSSTY